MSSKQQKQKYKMSFSTGGLLVNDCVEVAKLHEPGENWTETLERALSDRTMSLPKHVSNRRSLREITNRLRMLSGDDLDFLIYSDRQDQVAILWVAVCRAYRFIREFQSEVIRERFLSGKADLPLETFDRFFEEMAEWHEEISKISETTRLKLRQILFRMLREADIITGAYEIQPPLLSIKFTDYLASHNKEEVGFFPVVTN